MPADLKAFLLGAVPAAARPAIEEMDVDHIVPWDEKDMEEFSMKRTFTAYGTVVGQNERRTDIDYWQWYDQKNGIIWIGDDINHYQRDVEGQESIFAVSYRGSQLYLTLAGLDIEAMMGEGLPDAVKNLLDAGLDFSAAMIFGV